MDNDSSDKMFTQQRHVMKIKNKMFVVVMLAMCVMQFALLLLYILLTNTYELPPNVNVPSLSIVKDASNKEFVLIRFADSPPVSHSRFYMAEYDENGTSITLKERQLPIHPFAKPFVMNNEIVLEQLPYGKYDVFYGTKNIAQVGIGERISLYTIDGVSVQEVSSEPKAQISDRQ